MPRRLNTFQLRKLERQAEGEAVSGLRRRVDLARMRVRDAIAKAARSPKVATSKAARNALEATIAQHYGLLGKEFDGWLMDMLRENGPAWAGEIQGQIKGTGDVPLMEFSRERVKRYAELIHQGNDQNLAAVLTESMTTQAIKDLRFATVDTFRQASIEGWTANETHARLQASWDRASGNTEGKRFIDKGGKEWANSRYLQMLVRTTMQRATRDIQIDTLAENGFKLARISSDSGDPCPICEAWEGAIIQIAGSGQGGGRFPTYQQSLDAGMFHPNCTHRPEYIDEELEADEIAIQSEQPSPGAWEDPDKVLEYRNGIDQKRYQQQGMKADEARHAVMRDRMKGRLRAGGFGDRLAGEVDAIPPAVLDQMNLKTLPRFRYLKTDEGAETFSRNSSGGGWIVLDRKDGASEFKKGFYSLQTKRGVEIERTGKKAAPKPEVKPVKVTESEAKPKIFESAKSAGLYMRGVMSADMDKYIMKDGKPVTRFGHGRKKPIDRIGVVDLGKSSTELASVIANEMGAIGEECKRLGIPMLRGIYTSKRGAAAMGDGVLSINTECLENRLKAQSVISKATVSGMVTGPASVKTTLWHETAHHIHQQYGVIDGVTYKNPPMENQIKQAYMQSGKGKNSVSDYARTGGHKEWFAENYALAKTGRQSEVDNSPALMALFKQIGVM
jgi:hypothetical protein